MITNVCRFVWDYPSRGQSTYGLQPVFVNLSEEQARIGYEVHVVARLNPGQSSYEFTKGVHVHRVPFPFTVNGIRLYEKLRKDKRSWVAHAHATAGISLGLTRKLSRTPLVCHSHGTSRSHHVPLRFKSGKVVSDYSSLGITYDMLRERAFWFSADRVLTVSRTLMEDLSGYYKISRSKIRVVYNGVDTELFSPGKPMVLPAELAELADKRVILYVGHFGLRKGIVFLIRAMKEVLERVSDAHLLCVGGVPSWLGDGEYWALLKGEVQRNNLLGHVTLMDAVKNEKLPDYYRFSELLALPSYYESFSKVAIEAMACGRPVVGTATGGLPEVVQNESGGILVPFRAVEFLAGAIIRLLENNKERLRMGSWGRRRVEEMFTWRSVARRTKDAYDEIEP